MKGRVRNANYSSPYSKFKSFKFCLKCGKKFLSEGIFNRICIKCDLENQKEISSVFISYCEIEKDDI